MRLYLICQTSAEQLSTPAAACLTQIFMHWSLNQQVGAGLLPRPTHSRANEGPTSAEGSRCATSPIIIGGSCHKYHFCRDKRRFLFVLFFSDKHVFVATKRTYFSRYRRLSRQKLLKSYKSFVATKDLFRRDKNKHVLSRQAYFCRDKSRVLMIDDTCGSSRQ